MIAASQPPVPAILALMGIGVLVAIAGHVTKLRWLVITGLALLFLATAGMFAGAFVSYQDHGDPDPRPQRDVRQPSF